MTNVSSYLLLWLSIFIILAVLSLYIKDIACHFLRCNKNVRLTRVVDIIFLWNVSSRGIILTKNNIIIFLTISLTTYIALCLGL